MLCTVTPEQFEQLCSEVRAEFPTFRIVPKETSLWMRFLDSVLRCVTLWQMRTFMKNYVTTIGAVVYVPTSWATLDYAARAAVLRHERVHMRQARARGLFLYALLYLLVPVPFVFAYFRMRFEREAYEETIRAHYAYGLDVTRSEYRAWLLTQFRGPAYGWMWPFTGQFDVWFDRVVSRVVLSGVCSSVENTSS